MSVQGWLICLGISIFGMALMSFSETWDWFLRKMRGQ